MKIKATVEEVLSRIPGPVTTEWPMGERFAVALAHGTMSVEYYAPVGHDPQTPHEQDEVYFVHRGTGELVIEGERYPFKEATAFLYPPTLSTGSRISRAILEPGWYSGDPKEEKKV